MSVSAETRQEEIQVLDESPLKTFEIIKAWKKTPESHTTPAMSSEPMSTETPGLSSEPMSIVQPSETVAELMRLAELEDTRPIFKCGVYEVLKLLVESIETLFDQFAEEETLKKAMVRNLWTVLRPNITEGKFERVSNQPWAKDLKFGTHRLRQSWVDQRYDNLDEQGFPMPLPEDTLPEPQLDASYNVEPGNLNELNTWKLMAEEGEMTEEAMRQCSVLPFIEYEMSGLLDFEGLEEAKALLVSPKKRRIEAGLDVMLTSQGLSHEQKRRRGQRRIERMNAQRKGVKDTLVKMRPG